MSTATQPVLRLSLPAGVMTTVEAAFAVHGVQRVDLLAAVDAGEIVGALDVSASRGRVMRELRFPSVTLAEWVQGGRRARTDAELAELIFGRAGALVGSVKRQHVRRMLNVSEDLLTDLLKLAGERGLRLQEGCRLGAKSFTGNSPLIRWSELVRWLGVRRLDFTGGMVSPAQTQTK